MNRTPVETAAATEGSFRPYVSGFVLSIILTAIPFALVMRGMLPRPATVVVIFGFAIAQILVHLYYFLHLDFSPKSRWKLLSLLFALLIVILFVGGTIWIMSHLSYRLM